MLGGYRGKGAVPWVCLQKYGKGALESDNQRSQEARSRGKSRRGGQAEEERVWVPPRLSLSCHQLHSKRPCKSSESGGLQSLVVAFRLLLGSFIAGPVASTAPAPAPPSCLSLGATPRFSASSVLSPREQVVTNKADGRRLILRINPANTSLTSSLESQWGQGNR